MIHFVHIAVRESGGGSLIPFILKMWVTGGSGAVELSIRSSGFICHRYCQCQWWHIEASAIHSFSSSLLGVYGCSGCPRAQQQQQQQEQIRAAQSVSSLRAGWCVPQAWCDDQETDSCDCEVSQTGKHTHTHIETLKMETNSIAETGTERMHSHITHQENQWHWQHKTHNNAVLTVVNMLHRLYSYCDVCVCLLWRNASTILKHPLTTAKHIVVGIKARDGEVDEWCSDKLARATGYQQHPLQRTSDVAAPYGRVVCCCTLQGDTVLSILMTQSLLGNSLRAIVPQRVFCWYNQMAPHTHTKKV